MSDVAPIDQPEPPVSGTETETLLGSLNRQRTIFEWKCSGVDADGMRAKLSPSTMTLGGLVKHLTLVEDEYFSHRFLGQPELEPWVSVDWDADPDWEWNSAAGEAPVQLIERWRAAVDRSRTAVQRALAGAGIDTPANWQTRNGETPLLRRILIDMIEEYARHIGHADLIRESIDGLVGEDPRD